MVLFHFDVVAKPIFLLFILPGSLNTFSPSPPFLFLSFSLSFFSILFFFYFLFLCPRWFLDVCFPTFLLPEESSLVLPQLPMVSVLSWYCHSLSSRISKSNTALHFCTWKIISSFSYKQAYCPNACIFSYIWTFPSSLPCYPDSTSAQLWSLDVPPFSRSWHAVPLPDDDRAHDRWKPWKTIWKKTEEGFVVEVSATCAEENKTTKGTAGVECQGWEVTLSSWKWYT